MKQQLLFCSSFCGWWTQEGPKGAVLSWDSSCSCRQIWSKPLLPEGLIGLNVLEGLLRWLTVDAKTPVCGLFSSLVLKWLAFLYGDWFPPEQVSQENPGEEPGWLSLARPENSPSIKPSLLCSWNHRHRQRENKAQFLVRRVLKNPWPLKDPQWSSS